VSIRKPAAHDAQELPTSSPKKLRKAVAGHEGRDKFICAILACPELTPLELKVAVRLAVFLNCTTGQCNPGYPRLANEIGVAPRSARRAVAALITYGIVEVDRSEGVHHENKTNFRLFMPGRVTRPMSPVRIMAPPVQASGRVTRTNGAGDEQAPGRVTPRGPHNTDKNTERNTEQRDGFSTRPVLVDRGNVTEQERERAFGALIRVYPRYPDGGDPRGLFNRLLDEGIDPDQLIEAASNIDQQQLMPMSSWLGSLRS
jgi:hypothetical protein